MSRAKPLRPQSVSVVGVLPEAEDQGAVLATPAVRRRARELGISLDRVTGTGPRGSITLEDVALSASPAQSAADRHGEVERLPLRGLRRTIARNLLAAQSGHGIDADIAQSLSDEAQTIIDTI